MDEDLESELEPEEKPTRWARLRGVAGDKKVWLRVLLRSGLLALLPGLAAAKGGYTLLIPTVGAVFGVTAILTLVERYLASGERPTLLVVGAQLIGLSWLLLCVAWLEGHYVQAVLEAGQVSAGIGAVHAALEALFAGDESALVWVVFTAPFMASWLGLASAFQICNRNWKEERIEALQLLSGHTLLMAAIVLVASGQWQGIAPVLMSLLCPFMSSIVMTGLLFVTYAGVEKVVEPELPPRVRRERARRERARKRKRARPESGDAGEET